MGRQMHLNHDKIYISSGSDASSKQRTGGRNRAHYDVFIHSWAGGRRQGRVTGGILREGQVLGVVDSSVDPIDEADPRGHYRRRK
jgi:hypothetical protein